MASFVARAALFLIFGFFIYETIHQLNKLFSLSLNPSFAAVTAVLLYLFQEFVIRKWKSSVKESQVEKPTKAITNKILFLVVWVLVAIFFLGILVLWAGVMYLQIMKGSEGKSIFY